MRPLDHLVALFLVSGGTSILFSIVAAPIYFPTNSPGGLCFLPGGDSNMLAAAQLGGRVNFTQMSKL